MRKRKSVHYLIGIGAFILLLISGFIVGNEASSQTTDLSFKNYPDHTFDVKEYISAMKKGGHNLLIWRDPAVNLSQYKSVKVTNFGGRLLPQQTAFSYDPFINAFNSSFQSSLTLTKENSPNALLIEGAVVECNPGSQAARWIVGLGAGKTGGGVVCEVYEPKKTQPCVRIYTRDTGSSGGDSVSMLNHIFTQLGFRLATTLNTTIGH